MYPFVEYLLLGLAVTGIIMGVLTFSIVSRLRSAKSELKQLE